MSTEIKENLRTGLVIMASGLGKRFGGNKLIEPLEQKPLIKWIIDTTEGLFDKRIVVTRSEDVRELCKSLEIDHVFHSLPGRNDTVRLGLEALMEEIDYCFFTPGDQPLIERESICKLLDAAINNKDKIVRPFYGDFEGSPVGFPKCYFDNLLELPEGKGGNVIVKDTPESVLKIEVQNKHELWDIDTVSDLEKIKNVLKNSIN